MTPWLQGAMWEGGHLYMRSVSLPALWERATIACSLVGRLIRTEYDKPEDPPSRDVSTYLVCTHPLAEPRIHRCMPTGIVELGEYVREVVHGFHSERLGHGWNYSYHQRMRAYPGMDRPIDQLAAVVDKLTEATHTRRAQAVIWDPDLDAQDDHAPCLQRLWFRVFNGRLEMHVDIRSNDALKAAFMNMYAFVELQRHVAEELSGRLGYEVAVGNYVHKADSFHIYGAYMKEGAVGGVESLIKTAMTRAWPGRTYRSDAPEIAAMLRGE